jgi:hypothetical protein
MVHSAGAAARPVKRFDAWYDPHLVIRAGEDILESYDTWAIQELRRHHMVWSSWESASTVPPPHEADHPQMGFRVFEDFDPGRLRLFFASILWRAAASKRPEFSGINMPDADFARLTASVRNRAPLPDDFYPVTLMQFSTLGDIHLAAPQALMKSVTDDEGNILGATPAFRFYFDGLISYFHGPQHACRLGTIWAGRGWKRTTPCGSDNPLGRICSTAGYGAISCRSARCLA